QPQKNLMKTTHAYSLLAALALVAIAGCGKSPDSAPAEKSQEPTAQTPAPEAKKLNLFCWSEYVPQEIIDLFTKETGIEVSVETLASHAEMLAKLLSGGRAYDLIRPSEYVIEGLIKENLLHPIDHAAIPNLKNIAPEFK